MKQQKNKEVNITDAASYMKKRWECENSTLKRENPYTEVVWCSITDTSCRFCVCPKIAAVSKSKKRK